MKLRVTVVVFILVFTAVYLCQSAHVCQPSWLKTGKGIVAICPNPYGSDNAEWIAVNPSIPAYLNFSNGKTSWSVKVEPGFRILTRNRSAFFRQFPELSGLNVAEARITLSNSGGEIVLGNSRFHYRKAKPGVMYCRTPKGWKIRYQDWTDFKPLRLKTSYTLIETPASCTFRADRAIVFSYTYTAKTIDAGNVSYYLDAHPVGGIPKCEFNLKNVHFLKSKSYGFFHYKFAVFRNGTNGSAFAVITTENWRWYKRGYILVFKDDRVVRFLLKIANHDSRYAVKLKGENDRYSDRVEMPHVCCRSKSASFRGNVTVFVMPDVSIALKLINSAKKRLYIEAPYIKLYPELYRALMNASSRTRVLIVTGSPLKLEMHNVSIRYYPRPLHGKVIISDNRVLIMSANLDRYGLEKNREIGVLLDGKACNWMSRRFLEDYSSGTGEINRTSFVLGILVLSAVLLFMYFWISKP